MRPFFVGAAVLAILGVLVFLISPGAIVLHRQIFLELMLPAAYGGFLTAAMLEWTGYKGRLKTFKPCSETNGLRQKPFCFLRLMTFYPHCAEKDAANWRSGFLPMQVRAACVRL